MACWTRLGEADLPDRRFTLMMLDVCRHPSENASATKPNEVKLVKQCRKELVFPAFRRRNGSAVVTEAQLRAAWPQTHPFIRHFIVEMPERFLLACEHISAVLAGTGRRTLAGVNCRFAFVPDFRRQVPGFVRLDEHAVRSLFADEFKKLIPGFGVKGRRYVLNEAKAIRESQKAEHAEIRDNLKASNDKEGLDQETNTYAQLQDAWAAWDALPCFTHLLKSNEISERLEDFALTFDTNGVALHLQFCRVPRRRAVTPERADADDPAGAAPAAASGARNGSERAKRRRERIRRTEQTRAMERAPVEHRGPMTAGCRATLDAFLATQGLVSLDLAGPPHAPPTTPPPGGSSTNVSGVFAVVAQQLKLVGAGQSHTPPPPSPLLRPTPTLHPSTLSLPRPATRPPLPLTRRSSISPATSSSHPHSHLQAAGFAMSTGFGRSTASGPALRKAVAHRLRRLYPTNKKVFPGQRVQRHSSNK